MTQNLGGRHTSSSHAHPCRPGTVRVRDQPPTVLPYLAQGDARTAKLDALPWAGGVSFISCGVRVGVRADDASILDELPPYLPPVRASATTLVVDHLFSLRVGGAGGGPRRPRLYEGPRLIRRRRVVDTAATLDLLRSLLEFRIATNARSLLFVHAGVVEWSGHAILIPGRSLSGKTTLVTALLRAGAKYYSDEFAVLDAAGRVHPWARRLRIRSPGRPPRHYPVEAFGERARQTSLPVGLIVVTFHRAGARWRPRPLSPGQALLALMRNTHGARQRPDQTIKILGRAVRRAPAFAGRRGEAAELAATLLTNQNAEDCDRTGERQIAGGKRR